MIVTGFHHAGITVTSMAVSLGFYCDVLGLEVRSTRRITEGYVFEFTGVEASAVDVVFLAVPGSEAQVELLEYHGVDRQPASSQPSDPGNAHVCLLVDDLDAIYERMVAAGFRARSQRPVPIPVGPNAGGALLYAIDPDGTFVELLQRPSDR